ncbi:hypothetical protein HSEST_1500 [Halapricum desulfuricans]|uniref:Uncharacterized protein n=1 Tax=Halapricum desulfuricans TaxID=2841257 RepID=A0A897NWL8_9EURY|nr:hypothetical protein HSEST_1500 [Halapricum desulfuricans]
MIRCTSSVTRSARDMKPLSASHRIERAARDRTLPETRRKHHSPRRLAFRSAVSIEWYQMV